MGRKPLGVIEHIDDLCECLSINAITTTIHLVVVFLIYRVAPSPKHHTYTKIRYSHNASCFQFAGNPIAFVSIVG